MNGTYKVGKMVIPDGADVGMSWQQRDPIQVPFTDEKGYYTVSGLFVVNAHSRGIRAWAVDMGASSAPYAAVEVNGTTYVNGQIPTTAAQGIHGGIDAYLPPALPGGTYWIVAYGYGAAQGATGAGTWTMSVNTGTACPEVSVPGEILNYNQRHFSGGTQIYVPPYGIGSGLKLNIPVARNTALGSLCAEVFLSDIGDQMDLRYALPVGQSGRMGTVNGDGFRPMMSSAGTFAFTADYRSVEPLININFVALDLPNP